MVGDRRRLLEGLDLVSTVLGLLINLVEDHTDTRVALAALQVTHAGHTLPLLCRLIQVPAATLHRAPLWVLTSKLWLLLSTGPLETSRTLLLLVPTGLLLQM